MGNTTRLSKEHFLFFCRKNKNKSHTSLGLWVCLHEDLLDPPLKEPPSVFPSWLAKKWGSYWQFSSLRFLILSSKVLLVVLVVSIQCAWKVSKIRCYFHYHAQFKPKTLKKQHGIPSLYHWAHIGRTKCEPMTVSLQSSVCFLPPNPHWSEEQLY